MTIVNDDSSIINKRSFKVIDDPRVIISDCNRFIIQATGLVFTVTLVVVMLSVVMPSVAAPHKRQHCGGETRNV